MVIKWVWFLLLMGPALHQTLMVEGMIISRNVIYPSSETRIGRLSTCVSYSASTPRTSFEDINSYSYSHEKTSNLEKAASARNMDTRLGISQCDYLGSRKSHSPLQSPQTLNPAYISQGSLPSDVPPRKVDRKGSRPVFRAIAENISKKVKILHDWRYLFGQASDHEEDKVEDKISCLSEVQVGVLPTSTNRLDSPPQRLPEIDHHPRTKNFHEEVKVSYKLPCPSEVLHSNKFSPSNNEKPPSLPRPEASVRRARQSTSKVFPKHPQELFESHDVIGSQNISDNDLRSKDFTFQVYDFDTRVWGLSKKGV